MLNNDQDLQRLVAKLPIDTRVDPAHKQATRQRMLEQFARAYATPARPEGPLGWVRSLSVKTKSLAALAAVVVITAGILAVVYYGGGAKIALADVQKKLQSVSVVAFRAEMFYPGMTPTAAQMYVTADSRVRMEAPPDYIAVFDFLNGRMLILHPQQRMAIAGDVQNIDHNPYQRDWLKELQRIVGNEDARYLGTKTVDGVPCAGWQVTDQDEWTVTVWADAKSAELVRVEFQKDQTRMAISGFEYEVELDESMLSFQPPEGYRSGSITIDVAQAGEADVILLLEIWAMGNGDVFPDRLDSWKFQEAADRVNWRRLAESEEAARALSPIIARAFWWLNANPGWSYAGAGVTLGDAEAPIFWYRPQGTGAWRVIYGDLHVAAADAPPK